MPDFSVSSPQLLVRPAKQTELPPLKRMGRGPSLDYLTYANGPRQVGARNAVAGGVASFLRMGAEWANEKSLSVWLRKWLENNEQTIVQKLQQHGHRAFVVQVNYAVSDSFEVRHFMGRNIYLLGTVPTTSDVGQILTEQLLYGARVDEIPRNGTRFQYAYLVGERKV